MCSKLDAATPYKTLRALVCRPDFYEAAREIARDSADYSMWGAVQIYIDEEQKENYLPFYNAELLTQYLNRNKK
jgi:hypothetical protein